MQPSRGTGVQVRIGEVQEVQVATGAKKGDKQVTAVLVDGESIPADTVVLAMGPWTSANKLVGQLTQVTGLQSKQHSAEA